MENGKSKSAIIEYNFSILLLFSCNFLQSRILRLQQNVRKHSGADSVFLTRATRREIVSLYRFQKGIKTARRAAVPLCWFRIYTVVQQPGGLGLSFISSSSVMERISCGKSGTFAVFSLNVSSVYFFASPGLKPDRRGIAPKLQKNKQKPPRREIFASVRELFCELLNCFLQNG